MKNILTNLWPTINDLDSAKKAMKQGIGISIFVGVVSSGFGLASLLGYKTQYIITIKTRL